MDYISDWLNKAFRVAMSIGISDIIDILFLTALIFLVIKFLYDTSSMQLVFGIGIFMLVFLTVEWFDLKAMGFIVDNFLSVAIIAVVVVFQPELRRILEKMGSVSSFINKDRTDNNYYLRKKAIESIVEACEDIQNRKKGALIAIERNHPLGDIIERSTILDAEPDPALIRTIFFSETPLHDGAVIIRNNRLYAAGCFFRCDQDISRRATQKLVEKQDLGSRHRAAIIQSQISDAVIIVVSEETGAISVAEDGNLIRDINRLKLTQILEQRMPDSNSKRKLFVSKNS